MQRYKKNDKNEIYRDLRLFLARGTPHLNTNRLRLRIKNSLRKGGSTEAQK